MNMATSEFSKSTETGGLMLAIATKLTEAMKLTEKSDIPAQELKQKLQEAHDMALCVNGYCVARSSHLSPLLKNLKQGSFDLDLAQLYEDKKLNHKCVINMITDTGQVELLQLLVEQVHAKEILEVGTFTGYAAIGMAEVMASGGKVTGIDIEPYFCSYVNKIASDNNLNVEIIAGAALDVLKSLASQGRAYDFIYVDCVKTEYNDYYKIIMDNGMLTHGGILACDNVMWRGKAITKSDKSGQALDSFSEAISLDKRVTSVMLPCFDGLLLIRHKKN